MGMGFFVFYVLTLTFLFCHGELQTYLDLNCSPREYYVG